MDRNGILRFLRALSATNVAARGPWITASCPLAPFTHQSGKDAHPSFAIEVKDDAESRYNCFSCGGGDLMSLVFALKHHGASLPRYDLKTATEIAVADGEHPLHFNVKEWGQPAKALEEYVVFPERWLETFMPALQSPRASRYLSKRGLSQEIVQALDLRYDTELNAVCFPIRDFDKRLCGLRGRRIAPADDEPRYHMYGNHKGQRNTLVWYGESWIDFDQPLVLVESVFDLASVYRVYRNVAAPLSVSFSEPRAKRLKQATEIITLFDSDKAGDKARERISKYLPRTRCRHVHLPEGVKDPGELNVDDIRTLLQGLVKLPRGEAA